MTRPPGPQAVLLDFCGTVEVLHVGDSLTADVRGARALGIPALWVNRRNRPLPAEADAPDHMSADLTELLRIT